MALDLRAIIDGMISIGFYDVFLPFILVYALIFAILQKSKIFEGGSSSSNDARKVNALVSFTFALFVVASINIIRIFQELITNVAVIIVFILLVLIVLGMIFGDSYSEIFNDNKVRYSLGFIVFLAILIILFNVLGWLDIIFDWWVRNDITSIVWMFVGFGIFFFILYIISSGNNNNNS